MWYPVGTLSVKHCCNTELPNDCVTAVYTGQAACQLCCIKDQLLYIYDLPMFLGIMSDDSSEA
jgi:hypothetical protein